MKTSRALLVGFALGLIAGGILTALFTPYTGEELRERLKKEGKKLSNRVKDEIQNFVSRVGEEMTSIEEEE